MKKENVVHFSVQREIEFTNENTTINEFSSGNVNVNEAGTNGAMDLETGVFTTPVGGLYHFELYGMTKSHVEILLQAKGVTVGFTSADFSFTNGNSPTTISLATSVYFNLKRPGTLVQKRYGREYSNFRCLQHSFYRMACQRRIGTIEKCYVALESLFFIE